MSREPAGGITGAARALEHAGLVSISTAATPPLVRHKRPRPARNGSAGAGSRPPPCPVLSVQSRGRDGSGPAMPRASAPAPVSGPCPGCPGVARAGRTLARRVGVAG